MLISERLKKLRQANNMTQADLGKALGVHQKQESAYESGVHIHSTEILIKIGEVFNVTLEYLAFKAKIQPAKFNIRDRGILRRFVVVDRLSDKEKELSNEILDLVILKHRFRELAGSRTI